MKYRVVSVLKDNRPRFLIISDVEEMAILPSKYLKHLDQINASPNTVKSAAFALSYYYNYLQEQTIGLDEITLLSYSEQNKHFIDFLYWVKSGKHTEHNTQTSNKTCNMYLGAVFRYYQFLALERMEKQNTITGYTNFFSIQIYSVRLILTMTREKCIWILLRTRIFQKSIERNY